MTGGAFPQGGAIMFKHIPCRKKPKALQNAPGMRRAGICGVYPGEGRGCAANRTAQCISIYASRFDFLRALHLNIRVPFRVFDQPLNVVFLPASLLPCRLATFDCELAYETYQFVCCSKDIHLSGH